jgi:ribonuclease-3
MGAPEYVVTDTGPDHDKDFVAEVRVQGKVVGRGPGKSKREAEQIAATMAFTTLSDRA